MRRQGSRFNPRLLIGSIVLILLLAGCAQAPQSCPALPPRDLSEAAAFAEAPPPPGGARRPAG